MKEKMKEEITVNYNIDIDEIDSVAEAFNKECERLDTFHGGWKRGYYDSTLIWDGSFGNDDFFIRLGGIQKALKGLVYFNYNPMYGFSIILDHDATWNDVLTRMSEIDSIEVD